MIVIALYLLMLTGFGLFGLLMKAGKLRSVLRGIAVALTVPAATVLLFVLAFAIYLRTTAPPTLDTLSKDFPSQRPELETVLAMSNEDSSLYRIDPGWVYQKSADGKFEGPYMAGDFKVRLSPERWNTYRKYFKRNRIEQGIQRNEAGDAFFLFGSEGLLDRGYSTGILFCNSRTDTTAPSWRYEPCTMRVTNASGAREENKEAFEFRQLAPHWYAYKQGQG